MSAFWARKRRVLLFLAVALLAAGLWGLFSFFPALLPGHPGPDTTCLSQDPVLLTPLEPIASLAVDEEDLYWLTRGDSSALMKMSKDTGRVESLAGLQGEPYALLVDERSVFWVEGTWQPETVFVLQKLYKHTGQVTELLRTPGTIMQLAMDADHLFWLDHEENTVFHLPKTGGEPARLVSGLEGLAAVSILNGQVYLGGSDWLRVMQPQGPETLVATGRLLQELNIGIRDERSLFYVGPVVQDVDDRIIFVLHVDNYPGMISCTDNAAHIVSLPGTGGTPQILLSVAGSLQGFGVVSPFLYTLGACSGGQRLNLETGESTSLVIGYDAFNLVVDQEHLYWTDREGLKCMSRPGE